jgi:adenine-specific DNA-methyltransferase
MTDEPERIDPDSTDPAAERRAAFEELFPGILADGVLDATRLGELLDVPVTAPPDGRERFGLMWAGKQDAIRSLLTQSRGTLIPDLNRSTNFDESCNLLIEGDNLEVLKLLQRGYNDRVKLIYIDPPYNTGNDFIYDDDFEDPLGHYLEFSGQLDAEGNRIAADTEVTGRFHSRWLSMMYPRLHLARNLLAQDGGIFVSIDFNELHNLRAMMNEVFGEENFQREIVWRIGWLSGYKTMANNFIRNHDTLVFYGRDSSKLDFKKRYIDNVDFKPLVKDSANLADKLEELGLDRGTHDELLRFINHENRPDRYPLEDTWNSNEYDDLNSIAIVSFSGEKISKVLDLDEEYKGQKSVKMLQRVIEAVTSEDDIILDFFAGSGSTAEAVMAQNASDGGQRRCISVNIPEPIPEDSPTYTAGYHSVFDIGLARITKVMEKHEGAQRRGLKVFRLSESCLERPDREEGKLDLRENTIRSDADLDAIAAEVFLKEGVLLQAKWERLNACDAPVIVSDGVAVVLSFEIDDEIVESALELGARVVVFLEDGFAGLDSVKANAFTNARNREITVKTF